MRDLNIEFMELYKSVDRFIKDAYSSTEGVSEYIRQMEQNDFKGRRYVATWGADYDNLKRLRWIRNQLSHEVGYDSDICEDADYDWLEAFRSHLYSAGDPLALMSQAENAERQRHAEDQRRGQTQIRERQKAATTYSYSQNTPYQLPMRKTLWQKIKDLFSGK